MKRADPTETVLCACGCGTTIPAFNSQGHPRRYAHGHNRRGADVTPDTRAKLSERTTVQMRKKFGPRRTPGYRHRNYPGYREWRRDVLKRDDFTCQSCGKKLRSCFLHAHHIKSWADYPDLRLDLANGQTVCIPCHNRIHGYKVGEPPQPCACGCGGLCDPRYKFLRGHWTRVRQGEFTYKGRSHTTDSKNKMSQTHLERGVPPGRGAAISKAKKGKSIKGHPMSEETRQRLSATKREQYEDPEFAAKMGESIRTAGQKKRDAEPVVFCACGCGQPLPPRKPRRKQITYLPGHRHKGASPSEETRARMSDAAKQRSDETRARMSEAAKRRWAKKEPE